MARFIILIAILLIVVPFTPQIPGCVSAHMQKSGRVVDVESGEGLSNVFVISSARFVADSVFFGPSGNKVLYNVIVKTDSQGAFVIPSTWADMQIGIPGAHPRIRWVITVFEPGYAVVGDEISWENENAYGKPRYLPLSTAVTPEFSNDASALGDIGTIRMFKPTLTLKQAASYYGTIKGVGNPMKGSTDPRIVALRMKGYDLFAPWACSLDPDTDVDNLTALWLFGFARDDYAALKLIEQLDPDSYRLASHLRPGFKAKSVCNIITNGSGIP